MSDRPDELKLSLKNIARAVKSVTCSWYNIGVFLGVPESTLNTINQERDVERHQVMMLAKWLNLDPDASWEKLVSALDDVGEEAVAARIKSEFVDVVLPQKLTDSELQQTTDQPQQTTDKPQQSTDQPQQTDKPQLTSDQLQQPSQQTSQSQQTTSEQEQPQQTLRQQPEITTQQKQTSHQSQVAQRLSPEPELPPEKRKLVLQLPDISLQINS